MVRMMAKNSTPRGATEQAGALAFILSTVLLIATFSSCGLPTVTYLYPPVDFSVDSSGLSVKNDILNYDSAEGGTQTYRGIEIYYRIYPSAAAATSAIATLNTLASTYKNDPDSFVSLVAGSTYKFSRLRKKASTAQPLIQLAADDGRGYYINFSKSIDWSLSDENGNVISDVTRTLDSNANNSNLSFFEKDYNVGDYDFAGSGNATPTTQVYIVFFAVSYGIDQNTVGQTVYSAPYVASSYAEY